MTGAEIALVLLGVVALGSAVRVVTTRHLVHAALWLVVTLGALAGCYLLLAAEFLAWVQVLVYVGAVIILFLFGVMLTRAPMGRSDEYDHRHRWPGFLVAAGLFGVIWYAVGDEFGRSRVEPEGIGRTADVGAALLRNNVIAFEAISVLLLATLVGAVVLARRD